MYCLESDYSRFILNNVVRDVSCHELCFSTCKEDNFFSYCFVILFFDSNLEDFNCVSLFVGDSDIYSGSTGTGVDNG